MEKQAYPVVHLRGVGCDNGAAVLATNSPEWVTCKCCVFELLVRGAVGEQDRRVTAKMLGHGRWLELQS